MIDEDYIRNRITALHIKKGISEYKMILELGHSKGYIQSISSGRALPSMSEFLAICDYLDVTPRDFFDEAIGYPALIQQLHSSALRLSEDSLNVVLPLMERMERLENRTDDK